MVASTFFFTLASGLTTNCFLVMTQLLSTSFKKTTFHLCETVISMNYSLVNLYAKHLTHPSPVFFSLVMSENICNLYVT